MPRRAIAVALLLGATSIAVAQDEPAQPAESSAITFARQDAERARQIAVALQEEAEAAAQSPEMQAVAKATAAKAALDGLLQQATEAVAKAQEGQKAAQAELAAARKAAAEAKTAVESATAKAKSATEAKQRAASAQKTATAAVSLAEADLKRATDAKNEAEIPARQLLVEAAKAKLTAANAELSKAAAAEKAATDALNAAKTALAEKEKAVSAASAKVENAAKAVAAAEAEQTKVKALVDQAAKLLQDVTDHAKPAADAKKAADEAAAKAESRAEAVAARLARFEENPPTADPKAIREIGKLSFDRPAIGARIDPTGTFLLTGTQDKTLHRHDLLTREATPLEGHRSWIRRLALDPGGELLVTGDYSGSVAWWNPAEPNPRPIRVVKAHEGYVRGVAISPDRRFVATGGNDGFVRVWNADTGEKVAELDGHQRLSKLDEIAEKTERVFVNHVYNVAFDPAGEHLVSGDLVGVVKVWEVDGWKPVRDLDAGPLHKYDTTFRAHIGGVRGMDFSPDGKRLAVCGIGEVSNAFAGVGVPTAVVFDVESGERLAVLKPEKNFRGTCWSIRFHPSGEWLVGAGGGGSGSLWFWKPTEEKSFHDFKTPQVAYDVAFHPDGLRMAVALYDKTVRTYELLADPNAKKDAKAKE